jgi:hypothetical protein
MDNEIVTIKYDDGTKIIFKFLFKKSFSWKMLNDSRNIFLDWVSPPPPPLPNCCQQHCIFTLWKNVEPWK